LYTTDARLSSLNGENKALLDYYGSFRPFLSPHSSDWHPSGCEVSPFLRVNDVTGEVYYPRCGQRRKCLYHVDREAQHIGLIVRDAEPSGFMTITGLPTEWKSIQKKLACLFRKLRRTTTGFSWCYYIEYNESKKMAHAHAFTHGPWMHNGTLSEYSQNIGLGHVDYRTVQEGSFPYFYPTKLLRLDNYSSSKTARSGINAYLDLNGGRIHHNSRDFFRDPQYKITRKEALKTSRLRQFERTGEVIDSSSA
jgi:hypothetical protein